MQRTHFLFDVPADVLLFERGLLIKALLEILDTAVTPRRLLLLLLLFLLVLPSTPCLCKFRLEDKEVRQLDLISTTVEVEVLGEVSILLEL